jgi:hypothetical protein
MAAGTFNQPTAGYQQQQPYGAQPAYGAQPGAQGKSGLAVASLVTGIIALAIFWIWGAIIFAPMAIGFGIAGRNEVRRNPAKDGEGLATAGLVLGIVAAVLTVPWAVIVAMS